MLLFHGTRKKFERFDSAFFGTGEAGVGVGFYFTDNLKGAYQHATRYAPRPGEPLVYVCMLREPALILNPRKPIHRHTVEVQKHWELLPVAQYWAKDRKHWFDSLFRTLPIGNPEPAPSDSDKLIFLRDHGFQVVDDFEGDWTDAYVCGPSIVVLDEKILEIIEILPAEQLHAEIVGAPRVYELAETPQPLGETGILSRLRSKAVSHHSSSM